MTSSCQELMACSVAQHARNLHFTEVLLSGSRSLLVQWENRPFLNFFFINNISDEASFGNKINISSEY